MDMHPNSDAPAGAPVGPAPRLDYAQQSPQLLKKLTELNVAAAGGAIEESIRDLVELRASQINGCAFCMHMHAGDARKVGVPDEVLDTLAGWREAPWFSERERAALAWTERLTRLSEPMDDSREYDRLATHFTEKERTDLTYVIAMINVWNRFSVGFRREPE